MTFSWSFSPLKCSLSPQPPPLNQSIPHPFFLFRIFHTYFTDSRPPISPLQDCQVGVSSTESAKWLCKWAESEGLMTAGEFFGPFSFARWGSGLQAIAADVISMRRFAKRTVKKKNLLPLKQWKPLKANAVSHISSSAQSSSTSFSLLGCVKILTQDAS